MATAKQKAAARRNIKKAQAANRRKGHRSRRSSGGSSSSPGWAAVYQQGKTAAQVLSPVVPPVLELAQGNLSAQGAQSDLSTRFRDPGIRSRYVCGLFVSILDAWGSRKIRHTNALAQRSVTAAAPELYAVGTALADNDLDPDDTFSSFIETTSGFNPRGTTFSTRGRLRTYLALKYGGKAVRIAANAVPAFGKPIKKALNLMGLTL